MMELTVEEYCGKIQEVRDYIKKLRDTSTCLENVKNDAAVTIFKEYMSLPQKRSYDYSLIIITLYGILEAFNEQIACAYLSRLSTQITEYSKLPEDIQKNHVGLSLRFINSNSKKYGIIDQGAVVSNLNSCLNQKDGAYTLNLNAFRQHTANFREEIIREFFNQIGCQNIDKEICLDEDLTAYIRQSDGGDDTETEIPQSKYFEIVEDLVERRNVIAHGSEVDEILSINILDEYAQYLSFLLKAIYRSLLKEFFNIVISDKKMGNLGTAIKVYNNCIVCINSNHKLIRKGDTLIAKNIKGHLKWGKIQSIQIEKENVNEIKEDQSINIGMKVDFLAKENYTYYIYHSTCL